jgi:hypothetical protein
MGLFRKPEKVKSEQISEEGLPGLQPLKDEVFLYLLKEAISGKLSVYFAAVPLELIEPFDKKYNPSLHPVGMAAIQQVMTDWENGHFANSWVYPKDGNFILSDDYIIYFAALEGQPDYIPCLILGDPHQDGVKDIQGPLSLGFIKKQLGFG